MQHGLLSTSYVSSVLWSFGPPEAPSLKTFELKDSFKEPEYNHLRCYEAPKSIVVAFKAATDSMDSCGHVPIWLYGQQLRAELETHKQDLRIPVRPLLKKVAPSSSTGGLALFYMTPASLICGSWPTQQLTLVDKPEETKAEPCSRRQHLKSWKGLEHCELFWSFLSFPNPRPLSRSREAQPKEVWLWPQTTLPWNWVSCFLSSHM